MWDKLIWFSFGFLVASLLIYIKAVVSSIIDIEELWHETL